MPKYPIVFSKVPELRRSRIALAVRIDRQVSEAIDYEAELGVIIGKGGRGIEAANALDHVWGYTIINDVTARDLQGLHSQWLIGKSQDTFCPMGPWAVTRDEIDLADTQIRCWINGELRQNANTRDLIFDVPTIIATISAGVTLMPGDVIATGTPAGVGIGFTPPKYLVPGDVARIEIAGIGVLENEFREAARMSGASLGQIQLEIDGEGPPIVFLHGLGATSSSFQPLLDVARAAFAASAPICRAPGGRRALRHVTIEFLAETVVDIAEGGRRRAGASRRRIRWERSSRSISPWRRPMGREPHPVRPDRRARRRRARAARGTGPRSRGGTA